MHKIFEYMNGWFGFQFHFASDLWWTDSGQSKETRHYHLIRFSIFKEKTNPTSIGISLVLLWFKIVLGVTWS